MVQFTNNLATIISNEAEIEWNTLDAFVWREDENFSFEKRNTKKKENSIVHTLKMTSQKQGFDHACTAGYWFRTDTDRYGTVFTLHKSF